MGENWFGIQKKLINNSIPQNQLEGNLIYNETKISEIKSICEEKGIPFWKYVEQAEDWGIMELLLGKWKEMEKTIF